MAQISISSSEFLLPMHILIVIPWRTGIMRLFQGEYLSNARLVVFHLRGKKSFYNVTYKHRKAWLATPVVIQIHIVL